MRRTAARQSLTTAVFFAIAASSPKLFIRSALHPWLSPEPLIAIRGARTLRKQVVRRLPGRLRSLLERVSLPFQSYPGRLAESASVRMLLVTNYLEANGAPQLVVEMAAAFLTLGCEVIVASPSDGPLRQALQQIGATVLIAPDMISDGSRTMQALARAVDVAICNTVVTDQAVILLSLRIPCYWYVHEVSLLEDRLKDPKFAATVQACQRLWAGSELPATLLRPFRADVSVVPYGLNPLQMPATSPGAANQKLKIGLFGSIEPRKGQDLALAAMARLKPETAQTIELHVYGKVLEETFGAAVLKQIAQQPNVCYAGVITHEAYTQRLVDMDAILIPSRDDTLPLVSLDALGCGRVLLTTATVGTSTYLRDGVSGFVATEPTVAAVTDLLERAVAARATWKDVGEAGAAVFGVHFSRNAFVERLATCLEGVLVPALSS